MVDFVNLISDDSWRDALSAECDRGIFDSISAFLAAEEARGADVFPPQRQIFAAFNLTPIAKVSVVILGQDPYHGEGQAMGLAFSVPNGVKHPPSLRNIFKEIESDIGGPARKNGDLTDWAEQGVLLLNTVLTVEKGAAASHAGKGWEELTSATISRLSKSRSGIVYLLWGAHAQKYAALIDGERNAILTASHPSPLSAYRGFFGCGHFSKANAILRRRGETEIRWAG